MIMSSTMMMMDPELWRCLPEDLLEKVFARLPAHTISSLRCLSKRWKFLLACKRFSDQTPPVPPSHKPFFLRAIRGFNTGLLGYNPTSKQWRCLPLASVSRAFKSRCLVSSAGGLVCLYGKDVRSRSDGLIVCNPITEACRLLPPMPRNPFTTPGFYFVKVMVFDEKSKSYKLFLADMGGDTGDSDGPGCVVAQLYDSATDRWYVFGDGPTGFMMLSQGVFVNGVIYFVGTRWVTTPDSAHMHKTVLTFNLESNAFGELEADLRGPKLLMERHGRLSISVMFDSRTQNTTVLQLSGNGQNRWVEVDRIGVERSILRKAHRCVGQGDFVYFIEENGTPVICCNFLQSSWAYIEKPRHKCEFQAILLYHPSLHNSV